MRFHKALYLKELKQHRVVFALYVILIVVFTVMRQLQGWDTLSSHNGMAGHENPMTFWLNLGLFVFLPVVLVYSWYREEYARTSYQLLSVPVSPSTVLFNMYQAFLTVAPATIIMGLPMLLEPDKLTAAVTHPILLIAGLTLCRFGAHALLLGIACLVIARGQKYRRYRLLSALGTLILAIIAIPIGISIAFVITILMTGTLLKFRWYRFFASAAIIVAAAISTFLLVTGGEYAIVMLMVVFAGLLLINSGLGVMVYSVTRFEAHVDV